MSELRRDAYVSLLVAWDRLEDGVLLWCKGAEDRIENQSGDESLALFYQLSHDLRAEIDAFGAATHRATLLSDAEVEEELTSLFEMATKWVEGMLFPGEEHRDATSDIDEQVVRLRRAMQSELRLLDLGTS